MFNKFGPLAIVVCAPAFLLADFSYEQSTKMTGGAMAGAMKVAGIFSKQAREPIRGTVAVKGNRMANTSQHGTQVIDLDSETITDINLDRKTYTVITFAEMAKVMEEAMRKAKSGRESEKVDMDYKVSVKDTGESKQIAGLDTKHMILTMEMQGTDKESGQKGAMSVISDMWVAPKVSGYDEVRDFYQKMARKMAWTPGGSAMMAGQADVARGMAGVVKETAKLDGVPVLQIMRIGGTADGAPAPSSSGARSEPAEKPSIGGALGGALGGRLGGFGRKKKQEEPKKEETASAPPEAGGSGALMEMTTELSSFSNASVDASKFAIPSGFKQVEHQMRKAQ